MCAFLTLDAYLTAWGQLAKTSKRRGKLSGPARAAGALGRGGWGCRVLRHPGRQLHAGLGLDCIQHGGQAGEQVLEGRHGIGRALCGRADRPDVDLGVETADGCCHLTCSRHTGHYSGQNLRKRKSLLVGFELRTAVAMSPAAAFVQVNEQEKGRAEIMFMAEHSKASFP